MRLRQDLPVQMRLRYQRQVRLCEKGRRLPLQVRLCHQRQMRVREDLPVQMRLRYQRQVRLREEERREEICRSGKGHVLANSSQD